MPGANLFLWELRSWREAVLFGQHDKLLWSFKVGESPVVAKGDFLAGS
jgi:hypothetical protein